MYSNFIKFILVLFGFAPIFLMYWILELIITFRNLHFYILLELTRVESRRVKNDVVI